MKSPHEYADEFTAKAGVVLNDDQRAKLIGRIAAAMEASRVEALKNPGPICEECKDTGVLHPESEDERQCYDCAQGAAYDHQRHVDAGYAHKVGPLEEYLTRAVKNGCVDNRSVA